MVSCFSHTFQRHGMDSMSHDVRICFIDFTLICIFLVLQVCPLNKIKIDATHERDSTSFSKILHQWMCFTCWWHFVQGLENQLPEDRICCLIRHHKPFSQTALALQFSLSWYRCLTNYAKFVFYYLFSDALQHGIIRRPIVICRNIYIFFNFSCITN